MIVAVAIKGGLSGLIYSLPKPARHCDIIHTMSDAEIEVDNVNEGQGFLTSDGVFVDRKQAMKIAIDNNQILPDSLMLDELFSENLW